jgi:hypothetical protein
MKIQIDIENKTIKLEDKITLGKFIELMSSMFPNESWKEYELTPSIITNWFNPIVIDTWKYPWTTPWTTPWTNTVSYASNSDKPSPVYNFEINNDR